MYYSEDFVEEVRQRNDIVDIISSYVNLKRSGSNYVGLCPFHNEKTASNRCITALAVEPAATYLLF